jgi:hypothetical protein
MVSLAALWLPILVSAVLVFVASSILHMALKYHNSDYRKFSNEDDVRAAINKGNAAPGMYIMPWAMGPEAMKDPATAEKFAQGPVAVTYLRPKGMTQMGTLLGQWFVYLLIVSFFIAYIAAHTIAAGAPYLVVFRVVGAVGFLAYAGARPQTAIWWGEPWSANIKDVIDGLIYGCVTAGVFGWLWPKA